MWSSSELRLSADITPSAGDGLRLVGVRDDQHVRVQGPIDAVECLDALAGRGPADPDCRSRELCEIERMHRLPKLDQHVVGDVDDVVDGAYPRGLQPGGKPCG
jgi:hypothetical protein